MFLDHTVDCGFNGFPTNTAYSDTYRCSSRRIFPVSMRIHVGPGAFTRTFSLDAHVYVPRIPKALVHPWHQRGYATQSTLGRSTTPSRKQITVVSDDGRVQWKDLSRGEKAARTTQQTFNFGLILLGFVMTVRHFLDSKVQAHTS